MKIFPITSSLLIAALAAAPLADAAPKGRGKNPAKVSGKGKTSKPAAKKAKPQAKKTQAAPPQAAKPKADTPRENEPGGDGRKADTPKASGLQTAGTTAPATPADEAAYGEFLKRLDEQVKANTYDICPAMEHILTVTGDDDLAAGAWMKRASDAGNAAAQHYMANRVLSFIPADKADSQEVKDAVALLKKASAQGFIPATLDLAVCQKAGRGTEKDENAANATLMSACKGGNIEARFKWLLLTGRLSKYSDLERPEVKSEIERGNHHITYYMSAMAPDSQTQFNMLKEAASKGNAEALFTLSSLIHETDTPRSFELLQEAAKLHNSRAVFVLGSFLLEPDLGKVKDLNLTKNVKNGMHLVKLSSMLGNVQADLALGNAYYSGLYDTPKDMEASYLHYKQACELHGNVAAAASTGFMLLRGLGVGQDTQKGMDLLRQASRAGYAYASVLLAYAAYEGIGCEQDANKAIEYLQDAAGLRLSVAYVFMAYIYAKGGKNLPASEKDAQSYLDMASLDMGEQARKAFDELMKAPKWEPHP